MASMVQRVRDIFAPGGTPRHLAGILDPELGFKVAVNESTRELKVTVIGARHLPTLYGLTRPEGYVVKIKLFPGKDKFETKLQKESWPVFNQEFVFELSTSSNRIPEQLTGKFVVLTVYAILENVRASEETKPRGRLSGSSFRAFLENSLSSASGLKRSESTRNSERVSLYKRRTVGAVTYNLDAKAFTQRLRNNCLGTPDIWRAVKSISSGLVEPNKNVDNNKGSVELTMNYSLSEDGQNDMITLSLSRLRFAIQTMESHENITVRLLREGQALFLADHLVRCGMLDEMNIIAYVIQSSGLKHKPYHTVTIKFIPGDNRYFAFREQVPAIWSLYVKMKVYECNVPVARWKSDRFDPTISLKLEPTTATLHATVRNSNLYAVQCEVRLMCRNKLGKKSELGRLTIGPKDGHWVQVFDMPNTPVTLWHNFK